MLKLKLKQVLLAQGKTKPINWLRKHCGLTYRKAFNLVHNKQKSIAFEDLSKICSVMECTPNELFWWDNSTKHKVMEWHPCRAQLHEPSKDSNWILRVQGLNPDRVEVLQKTLEELELAKINEAKKIANELKQKEEKQEEDVDPIAPLD